MSSEQGLQRKTDSCPASTVFKYASEADMADALASFLRLPREMKEKLRQLGIDEAKIINKCREMMERSELDNAEKSRAIAMARRYQEKVLKMNSTIQNHNESIESFKVQIDIIKAQLESFDVQDAIDMQLEDERHLTKSATLARSEREEKRLWNESLMKELKAEILLRNTEITTCRKKFNEDHKKATINQARISLRHIKRLKDRKICSVYGMKRYHFWNSIRRTIAYNGSSTEEFEDTNANATEKPTSSTIASDEDHESHCNHAVGPKPFDKSAFEIIPHHLQLHCENCTTHGPTGSFAAQTHQCTECSLILCDTCRADLKVFENFTQRLTPEQMASRVQPADAGHFSLAAFNALYDMTVTDFSG